MAENVIVDEKKMLEDLKKPKVKKTKKEEKLEAEVERRVEERRKDEGWMTVDEVTKLIDKEIKNYEKVKKEDPRTNEYVVREWKERTFLRNDEFIKQLIKWGITIDHAHSLQDYHHKLSREDVAKFIREKNIYKKTHHK